MLHISLILIKANLKQIFLLNHRQRIVSWQTINAAVASSKFENINWLLEVERRSINHEFLVSMASRFISERVVDDDRLVSQSVVVSIHHFTMSWLSSLNRKNQLLLKELDLLSNWIECITVFLSMNGVCYTTSSRNRLMGPRRWHVLRNIWLHYSIELVITVKWICLHSLFHWFMLGENCQIRFLV